MLLVNIFILQYVVEAATSPNKIISGVCLQQNRTCLTSDRVQGSNMTHGTKKTQEWYEELKHDGTSMINAISKTILVGPLY